CARPYGYDVWFAYW
nr:immunoglobulin heavy chain junction region [Mus musculus]NSM08335.1 immunoglobulin heavy chain junction region [Mus musculus]